MAQMQTQNLAAAAAIVDGLAQGGLIELGPTRDACVTAVARAIDEHLAGVSKLDRDAETMADQHLQAAGREGLGLDRHRIVQMIRKRLAEERNFPL